MIVKLLNPTRSFAADVATVTMEMQLQDGLGTILHTATISASNNIRNIDFKEFLATQLIRQITAIRTSYLDVMQIIAALYPTATSPDEALTMLTAELEAVVNQ